MRHPFVVSVSLLKKIVDKTARQRYKISGDEFIELVRDDRMDLPESEDLAILVRKYILT